MKWHLNISYPAASAFAALKWSISLSLSFPFEASDWATSIEFFTSKIDAKTWPMAVVKRQRQKGQNQYDVIYAKQKNRKESLLFNKILCGSRKKISCKKIKWQKSWQTPQLIPFQFYQSITFIFLPISSSLMFSNVKTCSLFSCHIDLVKMWGLSNTWQ